jgi:GNAT superfamily N-acetyltransferase
MGGLGNPDRPVGGLSVHTPPGVELRPLGRDDFEVALQLMSELYGLAEPDPEPLRSRYEVLVNDPDWAPFIALADGEPAGMIGFAFRRRLNHATFEGWVSDLYVREAARGRGIGRALMSAALAEWRLRRGHRLTLEVSYERTAARALYESLGMTNAGKFFALSPVRGRGLAGPVRAIGQDDFEPVTRLLAELGRPAPAEDRLPALRRTYDHHLRRPSAASLLAEVEGRVVGVCSLEFREPFYLPAPQAWIPDLVVTEALRGTGIGAALLDAALAEAERRGSYQVVLESGHHRGAAHALYHAAGMRDVGSFFVLDR